LGVSASQSTFTLPVTTSELQGDWEVRYNGILLNAPKEYDSGGTYQQLAYADYIISGNSFTLTGQTGAMYAYNNANRRDVITATYVYSATTSPVTGISVQYMVTRVNPNMVGTTIQLPSAASGDVQLTINGIALTKGTSQFTADYVVDSMNPNQIIIQNPEFISYFATLPPNERFVQVAYISVTGNTSINARSEIYRVDSFNTGKLYYNSLAGKYVYKLNYKVNNANEVKLLIDGIGLEPGTDYTVNISNPYEIFLPSGIKYGTVISAYYLVGGVDYFNPIVGDVFGLGDISQLSFLEFIELLQRRMINARNRKTVTDFKGGWYPTLLNVYIQYLKRANLEPTNPLLSNGYTFENLYSFLSKYNAFFQRFVDQLLSATIILKKSGLLIRNSIFTKQKFAYKRGVNLYSGNTVSTLDMRGMAMIQYLGDDGSEFIIAQTIPAPPPPPPTLYVETIPGVLGSIITGGKNIVGYDLLTEYGVLYKKQADSIWCKNSQCGSLSVNTYATTLTGLDCSTNYEYKAFIKSNIYGYTGTSECTTTPAPPVTITLSTCPALSIDYNSIDNTGGIVSPSICGAAVDYYGMQYRAIGTVGEFSDLTLSPTALTFTSAGGSQFIYISGSPSNSFSILPYPLPSWINTEAPEPPAPTGVAHRIDVSGNGGGARSELICYTPTVGTMKCVCVSQAAYIPTSKSVCILCSPGGCGTNYIDEEILACGAFGSSAGGINPNMSPGECFYPTFTWCICKPATVHAPYPQCVELKRNGTTIYSKSVSSKAACSCSGTWTTCVFYGDCIEVVTCATAQEAEWGGQTKASRASIHISSIGAGAGSFTIGASPFSSSITCGGAYLPV